MKFVIEVCKFGGVDRRPIEIVRVPYGVFQINQDVEKRTVILEEMATREREITAELKDLRANKPEGWKETVRELSNDLVHLQKEGLSVVDSNFFEERFEAIKLILSANGIKETDELMDIKTWARKIDFVVPTAFIHTALSKDIKKVLAEIS